MSGLAATRVILGAEILGLRHRLMKRGRVRLAILVVAMAAAAVFIGGGAFTVGATAGKFLPTAIDTVLVGGFTGLSVLMLVVGFPTVIATFFVGRDLLQLALAPVRTIEIFAARLTLAMGANLLISCILLAVVLGIGYGTRAPVAYYVVAVFLIVAQVLVVTATQTVLMSVVLRWVPARLARDVAAAVAGLTGAGLYLAWNISLRQSFNTPVRPRHRQPEHARPAHRLAAAGMARPRAQLDHRRQLRSGRDVDAADPAPRRGAGGCREHPVRTYAARGPRHLWKHAVRLEAQGANRARCGSRRRLADAGDCTQGLARVSA